MKTEHYPVGRYQPYDLIPVKSLRDADHNLIDLAPETGVVHLQFRRFAGCPVCNLHLQAFRKHQELLKELDIREIIVFHSSPEQLKRYTRDFPFTLIADPAKALYRQFGVESAARSLASPQAWPGILKGVIRSLWEMIAAGKPVPPIHPSGGSLGLPADFLIAPEGRIIACKYGKHADDQWSLNELISLVNDYIKGGQP